MKSSIYRSIGHGAMTGTGNLMSLSNQFFSVMKTLKSLKGTDGVSLQALHWIRGSNEDMRIL